MPEVSCAVWYESFLRDVQKSRPSCWNRVRSVLGLLALAARPLPARPRCGLRAATGAEMSPDRCLGVFPPGMKHAAVQPEDGVFGSQRKPPQRLCRI